MKQKKKHSKEQLSEIIGYCFHPSPEHKAKYYHVSREKAHRKCLKDFRNKCRYFMPKEV